MQPRVKVAGNKTRGRKVAEPPPTQYEEIRMQRCLRNNALARHLGIPALVAILESTSVSHEKKKLKKKDDSGSEYNGEEDEESEADLCDDSLTHESDALQEITPAISIDKGLETFRNNCKKTTKRLPRMAPGGIRPQPKKRVIAPEQPQDVGSSRMTRSQKNFGALVLGSSSQVVGESHTLPPVVPQASGCSTEEGGHNFNVPTNEVDAGQHNDCHNEVNELTLNAPTDHENNHNEETNGDINFEADDEDEVVRGNNMGKALDRISRSKKSKLPLIIQAGRERPCSPTIAAKFATECNIAVRNHVPIFLHWKDYKNEKDIFKNFLGKVGARFNMDITAGPVKKACRTMMKKAIRQQRYKLKKKYFDPFPLHLVQTTSPVEHMSDQQWERLVKSWKEQKKLDACQKSKVSRGKVQFHQTTGSRSYEIHIENLGDKYKDEPPNALELFKECHYSKKRKVFTPAVQSAIAEMESKITDPVQDGEQPDVTVVVSDVLLHKTKKNKFLHNVGIQNKPGSSYALRRDLEAELVREKQGSDELRTLVNKQRQQMDAMAKQMEDSDKARAKQDEEMKQKQADTDALLRRLMSMIPHGTATG